MSRPPFLCNLPPYYLRFNTAETMRTIIELHSGILAEVHRHPHMGNGVSACDLCDFSGEFGCAAMYAPCIDFYAPCIDFDTPKMSAYLKRLAKPQIRLNTPSEARREAAGK